MLQVEFEEIKVELEKNNKNAEVLRANKNQLDGAFQEVKSNFPLEFNEIVKEI